MNLNVENTYSKFIDTLIKNTAAGFIDIEHYDGMSFDIDGYFYTIDYEDSIYICEQDNRYMLITIYKIENLCRSCPYRLDMFVEGDLGKFVWVNQTSGQRTLLFSYNFKTEEVIKGDIDLKSLTVSKLISQS